MTPRRDPEGRLPDGAGFVIGSMAGLIFWAALGFWLIPAAPDHPVSSKEVSHADQ
ncbi:hypothetical protein [uncultured Roseovarius sp.]|uniref:hypothetical protein n=1 Tax=uncultured Roseovarius sp. TaxID=293344 RepID=UPI00260DC8BB|nr:hypothetical protein [uncultured Roseovarius sp.]